MSSSQCTCVAITFLKCATRAGSLRASSSRFFAEVDGSSQSRRAGRRSSRVLAVLLLVAVAPAYAWSDEPPNWQPRSMTERYCSACSTHIASNCFRSYWPVASSRSGPTTSSVGMAWKLVDAAVIAPFRRSTLFLGVPPACVCVSDYTHGDTHTHTQVVAVRLRVSSSSRSRSERFLYAMAAVRNASWYVWRGGYATSDVA